MVFNFLQKFAVFMYLDIDDKAWNSECILDEGKDTGSYLIDSSLTELIVCFECSLPIQ